MNTFHSLVPVILVQLISQVRCVDHRRAIHRLPHRHKLPGLLPPHYPPPDQSSPNYPPYQFTPNPFAGPYGMPPPMYQPPFASPFGFTPNMQSALPHSQFSSQYQPTPSEYAAEEPADDFSAPNSESYMTPSTPPYIPPNPQASYGSPSSGYMPSNPPSSYTSSYMPSPSTYPSPSYASNQQYNYFTPSSQPSYALPPSGFAMSSAPSYFAQSPQLSTQTVPSYMPTTAQSAFMPTSQPSYILPNTQPAVQPQSPQTYVTPYAPSQALTPPLALPPAGYAANQTSLSTQQQVLPASSTTCSITFADNSTIIPPSKATENSTQINSTVPPLAPVNQPLNDLSQNTALLNSPQAADETPVISSNGETSTDMNSLPPQVKEFIDMIPNILAMPDSQAMAPNEQMQPPAEGKPRPSPFSLHKPSKKLLLHKRKSLHSPPTYYPPPYPAPGYPASPYSSSPYQPQLPLSMPSY